MSGENDSIIGQISEALKKPIYSKKEASREMNKNLSTTSHPREVENDYIDYDPFTHYVSNALMNNENQHATRRDIIGKWRRLSWYPEVDEAISEIIGEAIVFDAEEQVVELLLDDIDISDGIKTKVQDCFDNILRLLDFNKKGEDLFKQWYVDGQLNLEVVYDNANIKKGIQQLLVLSPYNIWKMKNADTGEMCYVMKDTPTFDWAADMKDAERLFKDEQIVQITSGLWSTDKKTPMSYINKAMKVINQLYLLEDAVVIWHITRSPEKRVFYIDTGNLPKAKAEEYIKRLIAKYRQKKIYNADSGTIENRSKSISILEDFWLPRNAQGRGTQIDTLSAQSGGMTDMQHIDYFVDKVYRALNVPSSRRQGLGNEGTNISINNSIDIEKDELKFFKFILKLRRRFNEMFVSLLKKDLLAKKVLSLEDWDKISEKIKLRFCDNNPYSEIKKLQILEMRMGVAGNAVGMVEEGYFSKTWIKREILQQTEEEIKDIEDELKKEIAAGEHDVPGEGEEGGFGGEEDGTFKSPAVQPGAPTMGPGGTATPMMAGTQKDASSYAFAQKAAKRQGDRGDKRTKKGAMLLSGDEGQIAEMVGAMMPSIAEMIRAEVSQALTDFKETQQKERISSLAGKLKEGDKVTNGQKTYVLKGGQLVEEDDA